MSWKAKYNPYLRISYDEDLLEMDTEGKGRVDDLVDFTQDILMNITTNYNVLLQIIPHLHYFANLIIAACAPARYRLQEI